MELEIGKSQAFGIFFSLSDHFTGNVQGCDKADSGSEGSCKAARSAADIRH